MSARGKARKRALDIIFEADAKQIPIGAVVGEHQRRRETEGQGELNPYSVEIAEGVAVNQEIIDSLISDYSTGWSLERMPTVDRAILRVAIYELLYNDEIPDAVVVSQAVELAKELSTEESGSFVHGVLGAISRSQSAAK